MSLSQPKEFRDFFSDVVEKIIDPLSNKCLFAVTDVELFMTGLDVCFLMCDQVREPDVGPTRRDAPAA